MLGSRTTGMVRLALLLTLSTVSACDRDPPSEDAAGEVLSPAAAAVSPDEFRYVPEGSPVELGLGGYAKVMCSAVFVSHRDPVEAARTSGYFMMPADELSLVSGPVVDRSAGTVTMTYADTLSRTARFMADQGCVLLPQGRSQPFYRPVPVRSSLPPADSLDWPMGDVHADEALADDIDADGLAAAVEMAFSDPDAHTAAFLVVHRGRIIAEEYGPGVDHDTQLESWSMGKSLTAALVGILIHEGSLTLEDAAPIDLWQAPGDPRGEIRIADLMRMSSGLHFIAPRDPDYDPSAGYPDHMYVYTGAVDVFEFSFNRPLQFPPGTEGRYRNSDPLTLGHIVREIVEERGEDYLTFPQRALFDRIGIRRQVLETDPYGNFLLTGYDYGTARNWARLGLLFLQDGVWAGERILPEGFVDFVRSPAPAWEEPIYGGLFWLNRDGAWNLPTDAYFMAGGGGQRTFVVPSLDLVVVRMGHFRGADPGAATLNDALGLLRLAVPERR